MRPAAKLQSVPAAPAIVRPSVIKRSLKVERVATALGAEISNVNLADAAHDRDQIAEIRSLLLQHKVLLFRDQDITPMQHQTFGEQFGELHVHPVFPMLAEAPKVFPLHRNTGETTRVVDEYSYENAWHLDAHYEEKPTMGSILRCLTCPELGGDTLWSNMVMAYDRLPQSIKETIGDLYARNHHEQVFLSHRKTEGRLAAAAAQPPVEHPVVYIHPETGEKVLFVSLFTTHFSNYYRFPRIRTGQDFMPEAQHLLQYLASQANIPEYHVRLRWKPNTVAFWDNRSTQHYAVHDYDAAPRSMHRVSILGD